MIVDDELAGRRMLREYCAAQADLELVGEFADGLVALEQIRQQAPDLLFLDIQMDTLGGIALARALDPATMPLIVFVTAYDHYALEAFEVSALDYLLKPFDEERFGKTLERARQRLQTHSSSDRYTALNGVLTQLEQHIRTIHPGTRPRLLAEAGGRMHVLDADRIEVVEADRNYVLLRAGRDAFHTRSTLQQAEAALQLQPMLRLSRSCLVNMNHVREVSRTPRGDFILVVSGGPTVPSSQGFRAELRHHLTLLKIRPHLTTAPRSDALATPYLIRRYRSYNSMSLSPNPRALSGKVPVWTHSSPSHLILNLSDAPTKFGV
jgi:two-component system LytT family response regulator